MIPASTIEDVYEIVARVFKFRKWQEIVQPQRFKYTAQKALAAQYAVLELLKSKGYGLTTVVAICNLPEACYAIWEPENIEAIKTYKAQIKMCFEELYNSQGVKALLKQPLTLNQPREAA